MEAKRDALTVCLAKAVEEIRNFVKPMGGQLSKDVQMEAGGHHNLATVTITVGFQEADLIRYISESDQP